MNWDEVKKDMNALADSGLRKAVKDRKGLKVTPLLKHVRRGQHCDLFPLYVAVAYGLNDQNAMEQLIALKRKYVSLRYGGREWGRWLDAQDIQPFTQIFGLWNESNWWTAAQEMIALDRAKELEAVLHLRTGNGKKVVDPVGQKSHLLWLACIKGTPAVFDLLLPRSNFQDGGHRCFIAAVHHNHLDIAQKILLKCEKAKELDNLRVEIDDYLTTEARDPDQIESAHTMYALLEQVVITHEINKMGSENATRPRKI